MKFNDIDLSADSGQFDGMIESMSKTGHSSQAKSLPSLNLSPLKSVSKQIEQISSNEYKVVLGKGISVAAAVQKLKASNIDVYDVVYSEDLEDNDLIRISERPLWSVEKAGNVLQITRVK